MNVKFMTKKLPLLLLVHTFIFATFLSSQASAKKRDSFLLALPVDKQLNNEKNALVVVRTSNDTQCKVQNLKVSLNGEEIAGTKFSATNYPREFSLEVELPGEGDYQLTVSDSQGRCPSQTRSISYQELSTAERTSGLLKSISIEQPSASLELSHFWGDAMLILALSNYQKSPVYRQEIFNFLETYFQDIATNGMDNIDHPDRAPMVMGNANYNQVTGQNYNQAIDNFVEFIKRPDMNELGMIDHMGHSRWKRIGSQIIGGVLGVPKSVWADSMMMYVMPTLMIGKMKPGIKVQPQVKKLRKNLTLQAEYSLFDFGKHQLQRMIDVLFTKDKLFKHTYDYAEDKFRPRQESAYWIRANGWALATLAFSLEFLEANDPFRKVVKTTLEESLKKILSLRIEPTNLWKTVLLSDNSYTQTDCSFKNHYELAGSSLVAWATSLAIKHGVLDDSYKTELKKTVDGIHRFISRENNSALAINWMSGMTNAHRDICGYVGSMYAPNDKNRSYGLGPYLLLLQSL